MHVRKNRFQLPEENYYNRNGGEGGVAFGGVGLKEGSQEVRLNHLTDKSNK